MPLNPVAVEIKAFVPAADLALSKEFYAALGFEFLWATDELAHVRHGTTSFLLQAFDEPAFIRNFQMHLLVDDVDDWHAQVTSAGIAARFGVKVGDPRDQAWGMRDFTLFDPSGVLWRVAQPLVRNERAPSRSAESVALFVPDIVAEAAGYAGTAAHFILYVADQALSAAFYGQVLGRPPRLDVPGMTEFRLPGGATLGLMPEAGIRSLLGARLPDAAPGRGIPRAELYLVVDDPGAFHARALAAGAVELSPLQARSWGHLAAYAMDPDGHVLAAARPIRAGDDAA